jgi:hypothetical protein
MQDHSPVFQSIKLKTTMTKVILDTSQLEQFDQNGVLIIRSHYNPADVIAVQQGIYDIIGSVMLRHKLPDARKPFAPENFDDGYVDMIRKERKFGSEVYDAVKQIPAFIRLLSDPVHEQLFRQLRPGSLPAIAAGGYGIRIDNPDEDHFRAQWHQEYPAQMRSLNGLVFWSSLVPVDETLGPVEFCLGSQREGALPVTTGSDDPKRKGAYSLMLHNEDHFLSKYKHIAPLCNPGDLVIIDFLVLHASGYNRSQRARWSMQFRYFDFTEPTGMSHGWKGSYAAGVDFRQIHPELCINS